MKKENWFVRGLKRIKSFLVDFPVKHQVALGVFIGAIGMLDFLSIAKLAAFYEEHA